MTGASGLEVLTNGGMDFVQEGEAASIKTSVRVPLAAKQKARLMAPDGGLFVLKCKQHLLDADALKADVTWRLFSSQSTVGVTNQIL